MVPTPNILPIRENQEFDDLFDDEQMLLPGIVPTTPRNTAPMSAYLARSPLFAPRKRGPRAMLNDYSIVSAGTATRIEYTGEELDMGDQDVFLQALQMAGGQPTDTPIKINRADFLRSLGRTGLGKQNYEWLKQAFFRLAKGTVMLETGNIKATFRLLGSLQHDTNTGDYFFSIPPETLSMFRRGAYGYVDLEQRKELLKRVDLAKWIQSYAASHKRTKEHCVSLEKLKLWCDYSERLHKFREALSEALSELQRVGFFESWSFYNENKFVRWQRSSPGPRSLPNSLMANPNPLPLALDVQK